ncbi:MAG: class I SAM-dependent methyltransferase [Actinomycetota bacterium]|nr:class I SAM-dependent methyltransferase [Actinomycetota bacterium]
MLEASYLEACDPRDQSGFQGHEARWERARRPIVSAVDRDGTFLDVGCANGLLMESLTAWAGEDGYRIEPYGLDLIGSLSELARSRLPHWADRIFTGNVMDWQPPFRFDFVRTELEYVPPERRQALVRRLLRDFLVPGGRLIVCSYGSSRRPAPKAEPVGEILSGWGYEVAGRAEGSDTNGVVFARIAWADRADTRYLLDRL